MRLPKALLLCAATVTLNANSGHDHPTTPSDADLNNFTAWPAEMQSMSDNGRARIERFLSDNGSSSFLVIYKGKIAFEYGDIHQKHLIHSIRKPLLALLYGHAIAAGHLELDETLSDLSLEEPTAAFLPQEGNATVRQLLQSRSGVYLPAAAESEQMQAARPERGSNQPGEAYYYNNWSFNSLGTLFEARAGQSIYDAFDAQLAKPLGMTRYANKTGSFAIEKGQDQDLSYADLDGFYLTETDKSRHAAYHFRLSAHDLALIGQLLVQRGQWNEQQLVSADWLDEITQCHSTINEDIGGGRSLCYGMMWQVVQQDGRASAFMHTGMGVHMIYVHPGAELVLVHRMDTENGAGEASAPVQSLIGMTFGALRSD